MELHKCYYSVPYKYLKEKVEIRYSTATVEIYHQNILIATHPRLHRINDTSTQKEHMPLNHQYANEKMNPTRLKNWGETVGESAYLFVNQKLEDAQYPTNAYRSTIAILNLAKLYGKENLNLALGYALSINATSTKSIESILAKKLYLFGLPTIATNNTILNTHENLRGKEYYQ